MTAKHVKDDWTYNTKASYYVLLLCFVLLMGFGAMNIILARKTRKFSKPIITFYLVSETVIFFRVLLFADPFAKWN